MSTDFQVNIRFTRMNPKIIVIMIDLGLAEQKLTASDAAFGATFGTSVALSGDVALVGAP